MEYSEMYLADVVGRFGEVFVVLDSGQEYQIHGTESYECDGDIVRIEGTSEGEYNIVEFPLDTIEHHYTHREV
jgi:hypothetical protein